MDLRSIGLDSKFRSITSLSNRGTFLRAIDFDSQNDRGAVTSVHLQDASINNAKLGTAVIGTANIGTLSFNEISGGTATFGGTTNGEGVVNVLDSGDVNRVTLNNSGITITDGKLTFVNSAGGTALDGSGIVSTISFPSDTVVNSTGYTTTSDTLVDVTGSTLDSFSLSRTTRVLVIVQAQMYNENFVSDQSHAEINCNDSVEGDLITVDYNCDWLLTAINQDVDKNVTGWDITMF